MGASPGIGRRIVGTEVEYGLYAPGDAAEAVAERLATAVACELERGPGHLGGYLPNGGRLYVDVGTHPEYATPECGSLTDAVAHELAGEALVALVVTQAAADGIIPAARLNKRVVDSAGHAWGAHENYLAPRSVTESELVRGLGPHLATRIAWAGAGMVRRDSRDRRRSRFVVGQKAWHLGQIAGQASLDNRALVSTRDEPHSDGGRWRRVHVTCADANLAPWAIWMRLGTTSLVLRLIEEGRVPDDLALADPLAAARLTASDPTCRRTLELANGRRWRPVQVQTELAARCARLAERSGVPPDEQVVLAAWQQACADLDHDPARLVDRCDWVAKLALLERYRERVGASWWDDRLARIDLLWDDLDPSVGLGLAQRRKGLLLPVVEQSEVDAARTLAPPTRARLRGRFVAAARHRTPAAVSWGRLRLWDTEVHLPDPYATSDPLVDELVARASGTTAAA